MTATAQHRRQPPGRPTIFEHIGEAKTGTTYLQNLLDENRDALLEAGLFYPPCGGSGHVLETFDLRRITFKGSPDPNIAGSWSRMVAAIREWGGAALISSELLAPASRTHIKRLRKSLGFADVHVVFTVRDLARQLPAAWQERIKNRGQETFGEWLNLIHEPRTVSNHAGRHFWNLHDVPEILARWSEGSPPDTTHVVTVPPSGGDPDLLWTRFAQVLGIDPAVCRQPGSSVNSSLGAAEASLVRQVNVALGGDDFPWPPYDRYMKWHLSPFLASRRGTPIDLPERNYEWATSTSQQTAKAIADAGYDVVGELEELTPSRRPTGMNPDEAPPELVADAGVAGIAALVELLATGAGADEVPALRERAETAERQVREHEELPPLERIKRCVVELSAQVRWLGALLGGYRRLRRRRPVDAA
jgi:hypothetical protein